MKDRDFVWFLLSLMILMLASPFMESLGVGEFVFSVTVLAVILIGICIKSHKRGFRVVSIGMGLLWLLATLGVAVDGRAAFLWASDAFLMIWCTMIGVRTVGTILSVENSDLNTLCAAASVYLLIAVAWAVSYSLIESLFPGSYSVMTEAQVDGRASTAMFLYFSLTTLTTLGYGDIVPLKPYSGIWAGFEAVAGIFYTTILIARLASILRIR